MVALPARIADSASVSCFFRPLRSALCPSATSAFSAFCLKSAAERSALRLWPAVFMLLFFSKCFRRPLFKSAAPGRCRSPPPRQRDRPGGTCVQIQSTSSQPFVTRTHAAWHPVQCRSVLDTNPAFVTLLPLQELPQPIIIHCQRLFPSSSYTLQLGDHTLHSSTTGHALPFACSPAPPPRLPS